MEPELKAILEEQKRPVTVSDPEAGVFTLDRGLNWFAAETDWLGQPIQLVFDRDEDQAACLQTARALLSCKEEWDRRARECAARRLPDQAGGEEAGREDFLAGLEPESIQVYGDGSFEFWFRGGGPLWDCSVRVGGTLADGPTEAGLEGYAE